MTAGHRSRLAALLAALLGVTSLAACGRAPRPPVVVVSIDTLRSDHLPVYGYRGIDTPGIDGLRRDAILYERAYSAIPLTLPSHVTLFSGRVPPRHGVRDNVGYELAPDLVPWLPSTLGAAGYSTAAFVSAFVLRRESGFARGFDLFEDNLIPRPDLPAGGVDRAGAETLALARRWLGERRPAEPFFLFLHLYEPHLPYDPPEPFRSRYAERPYDAEIAEADRLVGELIAELRRLGIYDEALVVLLSDHGEGLGDHGELEHGVLLYREALQVPLLVKLPGNARAGESVATPAQLADLLPTVAELLGLALPDDLDGRSLLALPAERALYAETHHSQLAYGWAPLYSLIRDRHQLIDGPLPELYDLVADPAQRRDLFASERRIAAGLRAELRARQVPLAPPAEQDEATRAKLAALGYLSAGPSAFDDPGSLPAPQLRIGALARAAHGATLLRQGAAAEAVDVLAPVLEENPRMVEGWTLLGSAHASLGDWPAALRAFEQCFEASGRDPNRAPGVARALIEVGRTAEGIALTTWSIESGMSDGTGVARIARRLLAAGDARAAEELLRAATARPRIAPQAKAALAELLAAAGRGAEAETVAREAVALEPRDPDAHEQLAYALLTSERFAAAAAAARAAVELDPRRANAWNHLGVALYRTGDAAGAIAAWERATTLEPQRFETLFNLGLVAAETGQRELAVRSLRDFLARAPAARYGDDFPRVRSTLAALEGGGS